MATFNEFWQLYPRKVAKVSAEKAWKKSRGDEIGDQIIAGLKRQLPHWTDPKFIPHPASWLNAGRWDDQLHVEVRPSAPPPRAQREAWPQQDGWKANINRVLVQLVYKAGGVSDETMARLIKGRDYYAAQFREMWGDSAPPDEFGPVMQNCIAAFRKVIQS